MSATVLLLGGTGRTGGYAEPIGQDHYRN